MAKKNSIFVCNNCGNEYPKWQAQCSACQEIDSLFEQKLDSHQIHQASNKGLTEVQTINEIDVDKANTVPTKIMELDRILIGGLTKGSYTLLAGLPGIGKSTMILNLVNNLSESFNNILYISGEEALSQIKQRAIRLKVNKDNIYLLSETNLLEIIGKLKDNKYDFVIIDSIQTIYHPEISSIAGGVAQVKSVAMELMRFTKANNITCIVVGHVTKDGDIAGPKLLEHMVDTVIYLEGEKTSNLRFINIQKNRFGPTDLVGIAKLTNDGFTQYDHREQIFEKSLVNESGVAKSATLKANRIFFCEIQSLLTKTDFGYPKRTAQGVDLTKLQLIIAIIQKKLQINLQNEDCFIKVIGDMKIAESSVDLAVLIAIVSSHYGIIIDDTTLFLGEIGLTGEILEVPEINKIITQAQDLGVKRIYLSSKNKIEKFKKIEIKEYLLIDDLVRDLLKER